MEASAGAVAAAPAAAPPASPASVPSAATLRSPAKGAASPKPLLARYAPPSTDRCPACGAPPLSEQDLAIVRKPGRRSTRDPEDPRNREENLVTREFLEKHIVTARMSLRDIGCFHGYTISTLSRRAKQEAVLVGARARNAAEAAAASQQDGTQQQGGPASKPAPRRKPSTSNKSRRKSQAAGGKDEVEDGSEAEGGMPHWQPTKRQRRAPGPARKPPLAVPGMGSLPPLPLVPLPLAGVALPMPAFIQTGAALDAQLQAQMAQAVQMRLVRAQHEQNEIFAHVLAQTRPPPPAPAAAAPAAQPASQQGGTDSKERGSGGGGQADDQEEREADTDEEDVAELLGLLRHRSPACPGSLTPPPPAPPAAAVAAAEGAAPPPAAAAEAAAPAEQRQPVKQEGQQPAEGQAAKQEEQQPGAARAPQAAAPSEQQPAGAAAVKQEAQPAGKQELPQPAATDAHAEQPQRKGDGGEAAAAASDGGAGDLALDPTLAPSTVPIDDPHLEPLCLSQHVSLVGGGTEPCSPTAASQPAAAASQQPDVQASQPEPAEWQGSQQPAGSQAGEGQGSHQVGAMPQQASHQRDAPQHAAWADQGSQPGSQPDGPAGSLSPQMAAVKSSATQLALGRAIEAFQAADIDSSVSMLLPLRRLQRAGKGGTALQQVVARWNDFPLARQQDLFSAAVLHALEGRWEALEADLALELAAGN